MKARVLFALFFASLAFDLYRMGPHWSVWIIPAALAGWLIADLISGLTHMYMDYRPCVPGTGVKDLYFWSGSRESAEFLALQETVYARIGAFERLVYDFKKHHPMPDLLGRHGLFHLMKAPVFFVTLPMSLFLNLMFAVWTAPAWLIAGSVTVIVGMSLSQYIHGSMHRSDPDLAVKALRAVGLAMRPEAHELHHATLTRDFAVINGWSNPLVNLVASALLERGWINEAGLTPT